MSGMSELEARLSELEAQYRRLALEGAAPGGARVVGFSSGNCTNNCTNNCTTTEVTGCCSAAGCTGSYCTGGCNPPDEEYHGP